MNEISIEDDLEKAVNTLSSIEGLTGLNHGEIRRELLGSMYPEKFTFENLQHRTARVDGAATIIFQINNKLEVKKQRASTEFSDLPGKVRPPGLEPGTKRL